MFGKKSELANNAAKFDIMDRTAQIQTSDDIHDLILQSGRNRLLLKITYSDVERLIEPYSWRNNNTGVLLLNAYDLVRDSNRSFYLDKIQNAELTDISFEPRWDIELE